MNRETILKWCDYLILFGLIVFIIVQPIKEHTNTIKSLGLGIPVFAWIIKIFLRKSLDWKKTALDIPLLIFIIISLLSAYFSVDTGESLRALKNFLLKFSCLYFVITNNFSTIEQVKKVLYGFMIINIVMSGVAVYNFFLSPVISGSVGSYAFSLDHIGLARFLVVTTPVFLIFLFKNLGKRISPVFVFLLFFPVLALILSYSRGGWLVFICMIIFWGFFKDWKKVFLIVACGLVFGALFSPSSVKDRVVTGFKDGALQNRPAYWKAATAMISDRPLLGFGYSVRIYKDVYPKYRPADAWDELPRHVHSTYFSAAVESGIPGLFALLWIYITYFLKTFNGIKKTNNYTDKSMLICFLTIFVGYLIYGLVEPMLVDQEGMYFWIMLGLSMVTLNSKAVNKNPKVYR